MTKTPYANKKKAKWQHKNVTENLDYTVIADRLRTFSWSNYKHPTDVVNPVYGLTAPLPTTVV